MKPAHPATRPGSRKSGAQRGQRLAMRELYRRAETRLEKKQKPGAGKAGRTRLAADSERLLHELQVHQIELEMQNAELNESRDRAEELLEKYTDLYDFAPVGYLSVDEQGQIMEANLTGATLLGVGRARLINRRLPAFLAPANRAGFQDFLKKIFAGSGKQVCEVAVVKENGATNRPAASAASAIAGPNAW